MVMNQLLRLSGMILQVSKWVHDNAIESLYSCMDLSESGIATNSHSHGENDENWVVPFFQTNAYTPWEFQDPKMEVLYHIKPDFWGVSPCRALRPNNMVGTSNKSVKWPLMYLLYPMFSHDFPMISHDFPMIFPWFPSVYPPNPLSLHLPRGPTQAQPVMVAGRLLLADRLLLPVALAIPLWQRGDCDG